MNVNIDRSRQLTEVSELKKIQRVDLHAIRINMGDTVYLNINIDLKWDKKQSIVLEAIEYKVKFKETELSKD